MAYEDKLLRRIDQERGVSNNPLFVDKIQTHWEKLRPQLKDFGDVYSRKEIETDGKQLNELKKKFEFKGETAIIGEVVIMEGVYEEQWLSKEVEVMPTSEYDDVKHGIDFVMRFEDEEEKKFMYLGVDVTTSLNPVVIENKRQDIFNFLSRGELGKLKYFEDPKAGIKGELRLPRIALVIDPEQTLRMEEIMVKKSRERSPIEKKILSEIKEKIEEQVIAQLENIIANIENKLLFAAHNPEKVKAYKEFLEKYQEILNKLKK